MISPADCPTTHSRPELIAGSKPRYPSLKGQINGALRQQSQLNAPHKLMLGIGNARELNGGDTSENFHCHFTYGRAEIELLLLCITHPDA
jgi:hypothetical protein